MRTLPLLLMLACQGAQGPPSLQIVSPEDGATTCGSPLRVQIAVQNFELTDEYIQDSPSDVGHAHLYLNGQEMIESGEPTMELDQVDDAEYQLTVDLATADHAALHPYVGQTIYVTVASSACPEP